MTITEKEIGRIDNILNGSCTANNICPVKDIMASFGDKWSMYTVLLLGKQKQMRFNELRLGISGISQRMLTVTLRSLKRNGVVSRNFYNNHLTKVEYSLTPLGESLLFQLLSFGGWAEENFEAILRARESYQEVHK